MTKPLTESGIFPPPPPQPPALFSLGEQPTSFHEVFPKRAVATETDFFPGIPRALSRSKLREERAAAMAKKGTVTSFPGSKLAYR